MARKRELPAPHPNIQIAPDIVNPDHIIRSIGTEDLTRLADTLQVWSTRISHLVSCIENAHAAKSEPEAVTRSNVIPFRLNVV
jgi:hypothetical protein